MSIIIYNWTESAKIVSRLVIPDILPYFKRNLNISCVRSHAKIGRAILVTGKK